MTIRQQFKRAVIEAIHDLPYDEAIKQERQSNVHPGFYKPRRITIGRALQAAANVEKFIFIDEGGNFYRGILEKGTAKQLFFDWKLAKENGQECTDDDQTDETIKELLKLLK